ncbi:MAG: toll/interleukin-1 receptor domain-containing protein [Bacteroidota bacterium]
MKNRIFISYRRDDSGGVSGRLHDYLERAFGAENVFKDIHDIPLGADFRKVIGNEILNSKVVLIVVGKEYTNLKDSSGNIRIMDENDYVNIEVATALAFRHEKIVIPVLVNGAGMPSHANLPSNLHELPFLNGVTLSNANWRTDVQKLIDSIESRLHIQKQKQASDRAQSESAAQARQSSTRNSQSRRRTAPPPQPTPAKSSSKGWMIATIVIGCLFFLYVLGSTDEAEAPPAATQNILPQDVSTSPPPVVEEPEPEPEVRPKPRRTYKQMIIGQWEVVGMEMSGQYATVADMMGAGTRMQVYFDGQNNRTTIQVPGMQPVFYDFPYSVENNHLYSQGLNGPIQSMDDSKMTISSSFQNVFEQRMLMHLERVQ